MIEQNSLTYNLYSTERRFKNETLISYYFQANKKIIKKFKPIDIDCERLRLNLETGEITNFTKKLVELSKISSVKRTQILINMILAMNDFDWFWTLTFDKDKINRFDDKQVFDCYKKYINNLSHKYPNFKYLCFPERHKDEDNCLHFHLVTSGITAKEMGLVNSGKVCCHWAKKKDKNGTSRNIGNCSKEFYEKTKHLYEHHETDGEPIYNITTFAYGFTTVSKIYSKERCNTYIKKYVEKDIGSTDIFKKRFYYSRNLNVPDIVKKLVGADFNTPQDINKLICLQNNLCIKNAKVKAYNDNHNVLQIKIDNKIKDLIDKGFEPLSEEQIKKIRRIF